MGKVLGLLIGAVVAVVGFILLIAWWSEFIVIIKGCLPLVFVVGGVVAVLAGLSELKDVLKSEEK